MAAAAHAAPPFAVATAPTAPVAAAAHAAPPFVVAAALLLPTATAAPTVHASPNCYCPFKSDS